MKQTALPSIQFYKKIITDFIFNYQRIILLVLFIPIVSLFFILEWNGTIFIFLLLGYLSAFVGFFFAQSTLIKDNFFNRNNRYYRHLSIFRNDIAVVINIKNLKSKFISPSIKKVLGYTNSNLIGKYILHLIHPEDRILFQEKIKPNLLIQNPNFTMVLRVINKIGEIRIMEINGNSIIREFKKTEEIILSFKDVTEKIKVEEANRKLMEELYRKDENDSNNSFTNIDNEEWFSAFEKMDLINPLQNIKKELSFLLNKSKISSRQEIKKHLQQIAHNTNQLDQIFENVQQLSSISPAATSFKKVDLNNVITNVVKEFKSKINTFNAEIHFKKLPQINGNSKQLETLFFHLIDNALKFRSSTKDPIIQINTYQKDHHWLLTFRDNGMGIQTKFHESIFQLFQTLHPSTQNKSTGIGLTICQRIIEIHGGEIWVESEGKDCGSIFKMMIPFAPFSQMESFKAPQIKSFEPMASSPNYQ